MFRFLSISLLAVACVNLAFGAGVESRQLQPAENLGSGETLFELMSSEQTGVHFENRYDRPNRWGTLWRQYFNGSIGTGVVLGDVNGDGLADIFAVGKDSPNALYINKDDFAFEDATERAGVAGSEGMGAGASFVDIDNDGDLDLYVCYVGYVNELFINDGAGVFEERASEWGLDLNTGSNAPSFADYDRDGDLDLYLQRNFLAASNIPEGMPDLLFENGGERFVDVTAAAGIEGNGQGHVALWSDFNEDGWLDIYVANDFAPADKLYLNNHDGTFKDAIKEMLPAAPYSAMGADVGDINNDGHMDLFVAEMAPRDRAYRQRTTAPLSGKLFSADKNGISQYMQNMLSLSTGNGRFVEIGNYSGLSATDWTWSPRLVDLDNDGLLDAFFTNGMARAFHDGDFTVQVARALSLRAKVAVFQRSAPLPEKNLAYRNVGDAQFEDASSQWGLDMLGVSFASAFADFDGDGDLDLVVSGWNEELAIYRNNSVEGNRVTIQLVGAESNSHGIGARVYATAGEETQMRELTLIRGYMGGDEPVVSFAFRNAEVIDSLKIEWPSGAIQVLENVNLGVRHVIVEEPTGAIVEKGELEFLLSKVLSPDENSPSFETATVYSDQYMKPFRELILDATYSVSELGRNGWSDGDFERLSDSGRVTARLDVDGDGTRELLVAGEENPRVYPKSFEHIVYAVADGKLESLDTGFASVFRELENVMDMLAVDIDGDGDEDLLTVSQWGKPLLWKSEDGELVAGEPLGLGSGYWSSVTAGDFNGDGRLDIALGNLGLNTKYHASVEAPVVLFSSIDDEASPRLFIECETVDGKLYPIESRLFHQTYLPEQMRATGNYKEYAELTVDEVFTNEVMETLERRELTELRSVILYQSESGNFVPKALPSFAQAGVAIDMLSEDFDADGDVDIAVIIQSRSPQPWVARAPDSSYVLLLNNDGTGHFQVTWPELGVALESGAEPLRFISTEGVGDSGTRFVVIALDGSRLVFSVASSE